MRIMPIVALVLLLGWVSVAHATDLDLRVEAVGCYSSDITIGPTCETRYRVVGELTDAATDGLSMVLFDLEFDGGSLSPADIPSELPMSSFSPPAGLTNPAGYGGTLVGGNLVQVGGSQNVVGHGQWPCEEDEECPADATCVDEICTAIDGLPLGTVVLGAAQPGASTFLAEGPLTAPAAPGSYLLQLTNPVANAIEKGAEGRPYWWNEPVEIGTVEGLAISVETGRECCDAYEACCLPNDSCTYAAPNDCIVLGGVPQGPGAFCEGDVDGDGSDGLCGDACPDDPTKTDPGACGCGIPDDDTDGDTVPDCIDECPGEDDLPDSDGDGLPDCLEDEPVPAVTGWGVGFLILALLASSFWFLRGRRHVKG